MNKRIKELAEQAGYTEAYYESDDGPFVPSEFDKEKFAELIILECSEIAKFGAMSISNHYPDAEFVEHQVKHHFGITDE